MIAACYIAILARLALYHLSIPHGDNCHRVLVLIRWLLYTQYPDGWLLLFAATTSFISSNIPLLIVVFILQNFCVVNALSARKLLSIGYQSMPRGWLLYSYAYCTHSLSTATTFSTLWCLRCCVFSIPTCCLFPSVAISGKKQRYNANNQPRRYSHPRQLWWILLRIVVCILQ